MPGIFFDPAGDVGAKANHRVDRLTRLEDSEATGEMIRRIEVGARLEPPIEGDSFREPVQLPMPRRFFGTIGNIRADGIKTPSVQGERSGSISHDAVGVCEA